MATVPNSAEWRYLCQQFIAVTDATPEIAKNMLEATTGNLEEAINLYLENSCRDTTNVSSSTAETISPQQEQEYVRDPIPQTQEVLVQGSNFVQRAYRKRKISSTSPFDNFRDYREEARIRESGETSSYSSKKRNLNDLFRPPIDLIHHGDFESARQRCRTEQKWLLVNLQDMKEFSCQVLNRDVWSNDIVRDIIKESFVFWQVYHDSEEGYRYARLYNVSSYPHIAIIDPRTGGKLLSLSKTEASTFCTTVTRFLSENPMIESPSKNRSKRKTNIIDHSEESQLEAAIAASIQESCVNHKTSEKVEETVILDSDSDVILSKSDDDFNESDSCEEDIGIKNEIRKPSIESEKSISEVMVINSVVRETDEVDLTRSKDQLLPEYTHTNPIKFLLRFPNGERRYASFQASATVKELLKFVSDQGYDMREYELITAFPRRNVSSFPLNSSLVNNGLQGNDTIFVQMK